MLCKALARLHVGLLLWALFGPAVFAGTLDAQVIALFPKSSSEFGYADLAEARQFSWFVPFETQALPLRFHRFEKFITEPQLGLASHIDTVVWTLSSSVAPAASSAPSPGDILGVAIGEFDPQTAQSFMQSQKTPTVNFERSTLYASASDYGASEVFFVFLDSSTVVFGSLDQVEALLRVRNAEAPSINENPAMIALINQANGNGVFWGVLNPSGTQQAIRQLVPEAGKFPGAQQIIDHMAALVINLDGSSETNLHLSFQGVSATPLDALILSQLLQAGVLLRRYQASQDNPDLASILDEVSIGATGSQCGISLTLTDDQLKSLIAHDTFTFSR
jgi:hypothetical protein